MTVRRFVAGLGLAVLTLTTATPAAAQVDKTDFEYLQTWVSCGEPLNRPNLIRVMVGGFGHFDVIRWKVRQVGGPILRDRTINNRTLGDGIYGETFGTWVRDGKRIRSRVWVPGTEHNDVFVSQTGCT